MVALRAFVDCLVAFSPTWLATLPDSVITELPASETAGGCVCDADLNDSGHITLDDLLTAAFCICNPTAFPGCDVNCDGTVDHRDLGQTMCQCYGGQTTCCAELDFGACCGSNWVSCVECDLDSCRVFGGAFQGAGTTCNENRCGPTASDCNANSTPESCDPVECANHADCDDGSTCTCDRCYCGVCFHQDIKFGDANCDCLATNLDDILCGLAGFGDFNACPSGNIHGTTGCANDSDIDLDDILSILTAFAGESACEPACTASCPQGKCCGSGYNNTTTLCTGGCVMGSPIVCFERDEIFAGTGSTCP